MSMGGKNKNCQITLVSKAPSTLNKVFVNDRDGPTSLKRAFYFA